MPSKFKKCKFHVLAHDSNEASQGLVDTCVSYIRAVVCPQRSPRLGSLVKAAWGGKKDVWVCVGRGMGRAVQARGRMRWGY